MTVGVMRSVRCWESGFGQVDVGVIRVTTRSTDNRWPWLVKGAIVEARRRRRRMAGLERAFLGLLVSQLNHGVNLAPDLLVRAVEHVESDGAHAQVLELLDEQAPLAQQADVGDHVLLALANRAWYKHLVAAVDAFLVVTVDVVFAGRRRRRRVEVEIVVPVFRDCFAADAPRAERVGDDVAALAVHVGHHGHAVAARVHPARRAATRRSTGSTVLILLPMHGTWSGRRVGRVGGTGLLLGPIEQVRPF